MILKRRSGVLTLLIALIAHFAVAPPCHAADPLEACWAAKLKVTAAYAKRIANCLRKEARGVPFAPCEIRAATAFRKWERAEEKASRAGASCDEGPSIQAGRQTVQSILRSAQGAIEAGVSGGGAAVGAGAGAAIDERDRAKLVDSIQKAATSYLVALLAAEARDAVKPDESALAARRDRAIAKYEKAIAKALGRAARRGIEAAVSAQGLALDVEEQAGDLVVAIEQGEPAPDPPPGGGGGGGRCGSPRVRAKVNGRSVSANGSNRVGYLQGIGCFGDDCVAIGADLGNRRGFTILLDNYYPEDGPRDFSSSCGATLGYAIDHNRNNLGDEDVWLDRCADVEVTASRNGCLSGSFSGTLWLEQGSGPSTVQVLEGEFSCVCKTPTTH